MNRVFLLLGGNQGNVAETFSKARTAILQQAGPVVKSSSLYESEPWGFEAEGRFLNQVLEVETALVPEELLKALLGIEEGLGRTRLPGVMSSRTIDIDILFFNEQIILNQDLEVPHPRLHLRRFTLLPLAEIAPALIHPLFGVTITELLENCADTLAVHKADAAIDPAG